jgi:hypothetical protein
MTSRLVVLILGCVSILSGAMLGVYDLTPDALRPGLIVLLWQQLPVYGVGVLGLVGLVQTNHNRRKLETVHEQVIEVDQKVNGRMSSLIDRNTRADELDARAEQDEREG